LHLQRAVAKHDRERKDLLECRDGAVGVSCDPEYIAPPHQHPSQPGPIVKRPGQGLGLT
jgi:hypothetical protein